MNKASSLIKGERQKRYQRSNGVEKNRRENEISQKPNGVNLIYCIYFYTWDFVFLCFCYLQFSIQRN